MCQIVADISLVMTVLFQPLIAMEQLALRDKYATTSVKLLSVKVSVRRRTLTGVFLSGQLRRAPDALKQLIKNKKRSVHLPVSIDLIFSKTDHHVLIWHSDIFEGVKCFSTSDSTEYGLINTRKGCVGTPKRYS